MNKETFVANWKMQFSFHEAIDFVKTNIEQLHLLAMLPEKEIILCPSFTELYPIALLTSDTQLHIGAQNVSSYVSGPYTGQVKAQSLADIGCTYCIIGHAESRTSLQETDETIAEECMQLFAQGITPIICISEKTLDSQLVFILELCSQTNNKQEYIIAFEPLSAIGSGKIPDLTYLSHIFSKLHTRCSTYSNPFRLLYGGSVHPDNAHALLQIHHVNGLLIGNASLCIKTFKAVVQATPL